MSEPPVEQHHDREQEAKATGHEVRSDVLVVLGCYLGLGVLGAALWWLLAEPAYFTVSEGGGLGMGEVELSRRFGADGWYVVIALVLGLLSGGALTWWRSRDHLLTTALLLAGSVLAAAVMTLLGRVLGPPDPATVAATAAVGDRVAAQLEVSARAAYLVWPIATFAGALMVLWSPSSDPSLRPGP